LAHKSRFSGAEKELQRAIEFLSQTGAARSFHGVQKERQKLNAAAICCRIAAERVTLFTRSVRPPTVLRAAEHRSIWYNNVALLKPPSTADLALTRAEIEKLLQSPFHLTSEKVRQRRFPRLPSSLRPIDLSLSIRVQNCLERLKASHGVTDLSQLSGLTIGKLLHLGNFGPKSLTNLLSSVMPVILDNATQPFSDAYQDKQPISAAVTRAAERLHAQSYSVRIRCTDPRFKSEVSTLLYVANSSSDDLALDASATLHAVAHQLVGRTRDFLPPVKTLEAIRKIQYKIARARKMALEQELGEITRAFAMGRDAEIIVSFFGWTGRGVKTLQAVGNDFHITRERVRQITSRFIEKINRTHPFAPTLKRTMVQISKHLPASVNDIQAELCRRGITQSLFCLEGVVGAAKVLGEPIPLVIDEDHGIRTAVRYQDVGITKAIVRSARKTVSHAGLGKVGRLCGLIQEERGTSIDSLVVVRALQSLASLHWMDERNEWFFLDDVLRNHLVTLVTKVLSIAPSIHVNDMRAAISGDFRAMGLAAPPKSVVIEFCKVACNCEVEGDTIIAKHPLSVVEALSKFEHLAYLVLADNGSLLHRSDFQRKCIERGMNPNTFEHYLAKLPILVRYAPGVYGFRGAPVMPGT
jgi:hypothetical protein